MKFLMKYLWVPSCVIVMSSCTYRGNERTILDDLFLGIFRKFRLNSYNSLKPEFTSKAHERELRKLDVLPETVDDQVPFPCLVEGMRSQARPTSVHKLRPGDIDVVGAIGDSLTAGNALSATRISLDTLAFEDRGKSFSIGGQDDWRKMLTLPNILKEFNRNLIGYSLGPSLTIQKASQFNVAEGGAISSQMPYMAKVLVLRITKDPRVHISKDWKLITFLIGDNDFCQEICHTSQSEEEILNLHREDLLQTLRILRDNLPRTFVNLVPPPSIEVLASFKNIPPQCESTHNLECPCIFRWNYRPYRDSYFEFMRKWQAVDMEVASYPEFDRDDFTVVAQPFFLNMDSILRVKNQLTYLAVDCFHFSQKGGATVASNLWRNMLEPVGNKSKHADINLNLKCPTEQSPYLYTRRNSLY